MSKAENLDRRCPGVKKPVPEALWLNANRVVEINSIEIIATFGCGNEVLYASLANSIFGCVSVSESILQGLVGVIGSFKGST